MNVEEECSSLEKASMYWMMIIQLVSTQSGCDAFLIKNGFHDSNDSFLMKDCCGNDAIC